MNILGQTKRSQSLYVYPIIIYVSILPTKTATTRRTERMGTAQTTSEASSGFER